MVQGMVGGYVNTPEWYSSIWESTTLIFVDLVTWRSLYECLSVMYALEQRQTGASYQVRGRRVESYG